MKKLFTIVLVALALNAANAQSLTEDFNFSGAVVNVNGWIGTAATPVPPAAALIPILTTSGLTTSGFDGSAIGSAASLGASGEDLTKALPATVSSGKLYMTFMVNVSATTTTGDYITGYTSGGPTYFTNYNLRIYVKAVPGGIDFGVSRGSVTTAPATAAAFTGNVYNLNQTYLITCRYEWLAGTADDACSIYIHPTTPNLVEPAAMSATNTGSTGVLDGTISAIFIRQGTTANGVAAVVDGFRVATTWSMTIPVELVSFTAKKSGNANKLAWQTASELNNNYFDIQRSTDGATFQTIGQVKGAGNSNSLINYDFTDETPSTGTNYYRLQQVDVNGKTTNSKTVAVNATGKGSVKVFPTLATDKLNVLTTSDKEEGFDIVNFVGQVVLKGRFTNSTDVNISQLAKGTYIMHIAGETVKFTKQ
jgi:hypothetical protein